MSQPYVDLTKTLQKYAMFMNQTKNYFKIIFLFMREKKLVILCQEDRSSVPFYTQSINQKFQNLTKCGIR